MKNKKGGMLSLADEIGHPLSENTPPLLNAAHGVPS